MTTAHPELEPAQTPTNTTRRKWPRWLWLLPLALAVGATLLVASQRAGEHVLLQRARGELDAGRGEAAEAALAALVRRPLLSRDARWNGAELFFRLGEDHPGNALLKGAQPDPADPRDRKLLDLAARCQHAASLLARADRTTHPEARLALARQALEQTPEAPLVLQRVVLEELLVLSKGDDPALFRQFEEDYQRLREGTPHLAAEVKQRLAGTLHEPVEYR